MLTMIHCGRPSTCFSERLTVYTAQWRYQTNRWASHLLLLPCFHDKTALLTNIVQAALTCLGHNADQSSHKTWNVFVGAAVTYLTSVAVAEDEQPEPDVAEPAVVDPEPAHVWPAALDAMVRDGAEDSDPGEGHAEVYVDGADQSHGASSQVLLQTSFNHLTPFAFCPVSIGPA
jgi:hypothetical protein